jgi:hypothetical protein
MSFHFKYTPEGGSPRTWTFDPGNPAWDLAYVTENETGWPWEEFMGKLAHGSHIALRALVYAFRKRDEPRLTIDAVTITIAEVDIDEVDDVEPKKVKGKAGEA